MNIKIARIIKKIFLYALYVYTIGGFYCKMKGYLGFGDISWWWVVGPLWLIVVGPVVMRWLFVFIFRVAAADTEKRVRR